MCVIAFKRLWRLEEEKVKSPKLFYGLEKESIKVEDIVSEKYNGALYKYMDFTKFMALLETESIFFARADTFDLYFREGELPENTKFINEFFYGKKVETEAERKNRLKHYLASIIHVNPKQYHNTSNFKHCKS